MLFYLQSLFFLITHSFVQYQIFTSTIYNNINEFSLTKIYLNFNFFGIFKKIQEIIPFPCNEGQFATESDVGGKE